MPFGKFQWMSGGVLCPVLTVEMQSGETLDEFMARCKSEILAHMNTYPRDQ